MFKYLYCWIWINHTNKENTETYTQTSIKINKCNAFKLLLTLLPAHEHTINLFPDIGQ